jgi:hypothetical protein
VFQEGVWLTKYLSTRLRVVQAIGHRPRAMLSWYEEYRSPRTFDPMHGLGFFLDEPPGDIKAAHDRLVRVLAAYQALLDTQGTRLVVAIFPQRFQVQPRDWRLVVAEYGLEESCFDLMAPNRRIRAFCEARAITIIDPTQAMAETHHATGADLYPLRGDMHWNAQGHRAFFDGLSGAMAEVLPDLPECGSPAFAVTDRVRGERSTTAAENPPPHPGASPTSR